MGVRGAFRTYTGYQANGWEAAESCLVTCVVSTGVRGGSWKLPWPLSQAAWQTFYEIRVGRGSIVRSVAAAGLTVSSSSN